MSGLLWPVKPMKRMCPCFFASTSLDAAPGGEARLRIAGPDDLVNLHQIDDVGAQTPHRLLELRRGHVLGAAVELGHEEHLFAPPALQSLAHALFALALVVVPAVVEERDAALHRRLHDADALALVLLHPDVKAPETDDGDAHAGFAQHAGGHLLAGDAGRRKPQLTLLGRSLGCAVRALAGGEHHGAAEGGSSRDGVRSDHAYACSKNGAPARPRTMRVRSRPLRCQLASVGRARRPTIRR